jgi:hypothetical protein
MKKLWSRLRGHFQENVARYSVLAVGILTPTAGYLGTLAAQFGADTPVGKALIGASSAIGVAIAGITFIRNLGIWQMLDQFGTAPGVSGPASRPLSGTIPVQVSSGWVTSPPTSSGAGDVTLYEGPDEMGGLDDEPLPMDHIDPADEQRDLHDAEGA